jgi:hypothetical protein
MKDNKLLYLCKVPFKTADKKLVNRVCMVMAKSKIEWNVRKEKTDGRSESF